MPRRTPSRPTSWETESEGISRDRWDVEIETDDDRVLVPCGALRDRISQELARTIFGAVKTVIEPGERTPPTA